MVLASIDMLATAASALDVILAMYLLKRSFLLKYTPSHYTVGLMGIIDILPLFSGSWIAGDLSCCLQV